MKRKKPEEIKVNYSLVDLPPKHGYYPDQQRKRIVTDSGIVIGEVEYIEPKPYWRSVGYMDSSQDLDLCVKYVVQRWLRSNANKQALAKKESELDY